MYLMQLQQSQMDHASQGSQTYEMNVTSLPPTSGVDVRVYKTVANGKCFLGNPISLTLGSNTITVPVLLLIERLNFSFQTLEMCR